MARAIQVHSPEEAARLLGGISVSTLVALLKSRGYAYTALSPGARPWGRGRQLWGLTDDQIAEVIAGQARRHARPEDAAPATATQRASAVPGIPGHDGKDRIRRPRTRARP